MGDGTKENPYTRKDVLRRIRKNGGDARRLDLSDKWFEAGINLSGRDLRGIILTNAIFPVHFERGKLVGANLQGTNLEGSRLWHAQLERAYLFDAHLEEANLRGIYLEEANLQSANLEGADLTGARLEGALLTDVRLSSDTKLHNVDWGNYILAEERHGPLDWAEDTYRQLKQWYTNAGMYDEAGKFFFREMEVKKKVMKGQPLSLYKIRHGVYGLICGYGERPWHVVVWGVSVLFGLALLYFFLRGVAPHTLTVQAFLGSLYYSAVSFTALGYGPWFSTSSIRGWVQGFGAAEAIVGVFTIALFLVTFTRKMTR